MRYDVENRMVIGAYEADPLPALSHICPSCKSEWDFYMEDDMDGTWHSDGKRSKRMPFNARVCARCAAYERSTDSMLRFVEAQGLEVEIVRYGFPQLAAGQREEAQKALYTTMRAFSPQMIANIIDNYIDDIGGQAYTWWAVENL